MKQFKTIRSVLIAMSMIFMAACSSHQLQLNDVHSKLNVSKQGEIFAPTSIQEIQKLVRQAKAEGKAMSISGGKHSMGGQQFGEGTLHLDLTKFNDVISFDEKSGIVEVEAGIQWPELVDWLISHQEGKWPQWGIRQKQTGADRLSIGGAISTNIHGRGLTFKPFVDDLVSFTLVKSDGEIVNCSRNENRELFRLTVGGYGLFGVIGNVKVKLVRRQKLERVVEVIEAKDVIPKIEQRIREGHLYGDFQFAIDGKSPDFLNRGVFSTYKPISDSAEMPKVEKELRGENWRNLLYFAHADKTKAFQAYSKFYLSSNGQHYWTDTHQMGVYLDDYHGEIDQKMNAKVPGTEMISEVYVPRNRLSKFLKELAQDFAAKSVNVIYGTVRFIEPDDVSFLPWAKKQFATFVFNLHVDHSPEGIEKAKGEFQSLIDHALNNGGSYFLTYHRWARKDQVLKAYPQFVQFLRLKKKYDPEERFQSDWYRHYKQMFAQELAN